MLSASTNCKKRLCFFNMPYSVWSSFPTKPNGAMSFDTSNDAGNDAGNNAGNDAGNNAENDAGNNAGNDASDRISFTLSDGTFLCQSPWRK